MMIPDLETLLKGTPYLSYSYAYPHKTAYRPLDPALPLSEVWANEDKNALFLYFHIPFCEMRCGFCNLFTTPNPSADIEKPYLDALERQAIATRDALGDSFRFARIALGGGTPTYLSVAGLERVFDIAAGFFAASPESLPTSVESSPRTVLEGDGEAKVRVLAERGVSRVSIGVQSFLESETAVIGRAQKTDQVLLALERLRNSTIPILNIDLIYGLPGQTRETWERSLKMALRFAPEEIYLYPLYVRPLTGLDGKQPFVQSDWDRQRQDLYRQACELLGEAGYGRLSMRLFRANHAPQETENEGPVYCTQEDGMVGLGCGARSYTRALHYSSEYAVGRAGVKSIIADYIGKGSEDFAVADYGIYLTPEEQRRRYVIYALLSDGGIDAHSYQQHFGTDVYVDLPQLKELETAELAGVYGSAFFSLTPQGIDYSDVIGPYLYSDAMQVRMSTFALK